MKARDTVMRIRNGGKSAKRKKRGGHREKRRKRSLEHRHTQGTHSTYTLSAAHMTKTVVCVL